MAKSTEKEKIKPSRHAALESARELTISGAEKTRSQKNA
jgi:hypothetical protein